jgi:predicted nucleic acid-binding protein
MIFIDTGAFLARYVERDRHHQAAVEAWEQLRQRRLRCLTSNFVLDEVLTLLGRRISYKFAAERAAALWASEALTISRPDAKDELAAIELFSRFADQRVSFTDCISFALMKRHRSRRAFTFDHHFEVAGFERWPSRPDTLRR